MWARAIFVDGEYYVLQEDYDELEEENKNLNERIKELENELEYVRTIKDSAEETLKEVREENKKLKETIKDHQLYEEKLEHRIIELEELLHWE